MAEVHGDTHLEELSVLCSDTNKVERVPASSMFIFIGALPRTDWLGDMVERDDRGFILTGPDLMQDRQRPKGWTSTVIRFFWRRMFRASLPSATCAMDRSNASLPASAKDRWPCSSYIST